MCRSCLRTAHLEKVAAILKDPEASQNDRYVALAMLRNADTSSKGILPFCQDTGTATVFGKKGQQVWTGVKDEEYLAKGVYKTYTEENLRYSQTAPLNMYDEVDTGTNLPAQIDLMATDGMEYQFSLRHQRRRLGEQDHALSGNQSAAESGELGEISH